LIQRPAQRIDTFVGQTGTFRLDRSLPTPQRPQSFRFAGTRHTGRISFLGNPFRHGLSLAQDDHVS